MTVKNRFAILLAEKGTREGRRISIAEASRESKVAARTLQQWASNKISRYDRDVIDALCKYFDCDLCALLVYQEETE